MPRLLLVGLYLAACCGPGQAALPAGTGGENASQHLDAPHLVLVSLDGFRWDYPDRYELPALRRIEAAGARAERLLPSWPTLTFPNHYTLVTGLVPARHGIVANNFPTPDRDRWYRLKDRSAVGDGRFYGGEPLWVTAETQGMVAATYFWVGSEAEIGGIRPTHWRPYDKQVPARERVEQVLDWLAEPALTRPHLVTLYLEEADDQAHWNGIDSPGFTGALRNIDTALQRLLDGIAALDLPAGVHLALVSDHGHMPYGTAPPFILDQHLDLSGWALVDGGPYVMGWQDGPDALAASALADQANRLWAHGTAFTRATAPPAWGLADNPRFPDLVFQANAGRGVISSATMHDKISAGDHGWAPEVPQMHGIFMLMGPGIVPGGRTGPVRNVDVHPFLVELLGLRAPGGLDGDARSLRALRE